LAFPLIEDYPDNAESDVRELPQGDTPE
jgi:hypothetical protein